ncbi:MAG: hypothetical protein Q9217_000065 [Psora testacea]
MPKRRPGNQHNNRHENGVVAPGKRISKQKSNGHLNGSAEESLFANVVPNPTPPSARTTPPVNDKRINGQFTNSRDGLYLALGQEDILPEQAGADARDLSTSDRHINGTARSTGSKSDRSTHKTHAVRKDHVLCLPLTILRSCPPGDTLTILIILLSIPSTVLTLINTLFAMLTFMPPAGSFFSIPNTFNDMFQGSGGTPSLATIVITDIMGLLIWLVVWTPVQALTVEFTQAVVAATLGGGNTSRKSSYDSTLLCMGIVTVRHLSGRGWVPPRIFGFEWPAILSKIPYVSDRTPSFISVSNEAFLTADTKGGWGWFRILVALHILIQGLVHMARRWLQKREYFQKASTGKKADPEAGAGTPVRSNSNTLRENGGPINATATPAVTAKASLAVIKDARDKTSSGKKRRKQANLVRSQQPLWAAFAATKVTIMREYEQTHSLAEIAVPNATSPSDLGDAQFSDAGDRVWISEVHPDSFIFHTTCCTAPIYARDRFKMEAGASVDRSKPFYVRINDTDWTSTKIERRQDGKEAGGLWDGTVFGLASSSSYRCSLVQSEDDVVLFSATVTTTPSLVDENEPLAASNELPYKNRPPYSPTSPATTLRKSISTFEASLNESNARQKRSKKENKAVSSTIKKDIDVFNGKISKLGSENRAHINRHLQWNQHIRQADEAVSSITNEIESLGCIPEEELKISRDKKASWDEARRQQTATREQLFCGKDAAYREKSAVQNEAASVQQKKDRLLARRAKLNDQLERLQSATAQGLTDKERKNSEQAAKDMERMRAEQQLQEQISSYNQAWQESRLLFSHYMHQAQDFESAFQEQQALASAPRPEERPLTPEGDLPGENPQNAAAAPFRFPTFGTADPTGGLRSHSGSIRHIDHRPRSTSLLSGNSHYTDFEDQDPAPPMPSRAVEAIRDRGRKRSGGSAGGSSGSNSQRDPASPVVGNRAQDSPHPNRSLCLTSFKEPSPSRQILSTTGPHRPSLSIGEDRVQHNEPFRTSPTAPVSVSSKLTDITLRHSTFSSSESLAQDQSALSTQSSHPTTPTSGKRLADVLAKEADSFTDKAMGQKASTIRRKPVQLRDKSSLDAFSTSPPRSPDTSPEKSSAERDASSILRHRVSSAQLPIPRRRSSLTALHLDSSHFETPISHYDELKHRASTINSSVRPITRSPSTITPSGATQRQRGDTLSPPTFSTLPPDPPSTTSGQGSTPSPSSPVPPHIHLPKTFPDGPISTPRPPLTNTHYQCYMLHRRMPRSSNKLCPVPCMTCGMVKGDIYWKCVWCCLRICGECMAVFTGKGRNVDVLLEWLNRGVEDAVEEGKKTMEKELVSNEKAKENLEVKEVGVIVTEILSKRAAATILRESRG